MKIALAQINTTHDVSANLRKVQEHTETAADLGAQLVVFPEATMVGFGGDLAEAARSHHREWVTELQWLAAEHEVTIMVGEFGLSEKDDDARVRNLLAVYTGQGERYEYAKIHLFDAFGYDESETVQPGSEPRILTLDGVTVGLSVCYDVRFPQLYTALARAGAQVMIVAASWGAGEQKADQWRVLTRARALDSNAVVVAVGQADPAVSGEAVHPTAPTGVGHSLVASPFGEVLAELGGAEELRVVEIDLSMVQQAAEKLPVLANAVEIRLPHHP